MDQEYWLIPSVNMLTKCLSIYRPIPDQHITHVLANMSTDIGHHSTDWYVRRCLINTRLRLYWHSGAPIWQTRYDGWECRKLWKDLKKTNHRFMLIYSISNTIPISKWISECDVEWFFHIQNKSRKVYRVFWQILLADRIWLFQKNNWNQSALWANSWIDTWFFGLCWMLSCLGNLWLMVISRVRAVVQCSLM